MNGCFFLAQQIFRAIHNAYIGYASNPFSNCSDDTVSAPAPPIRSAKFEKAIDLIGSANDTV
jgi:hypothetical protein